MSLAGPYNYTGDDMKNVIVSSYDNQQHFPLHTWEVFDNQSISQSINQLGFFYYSAS